MENSNTDNFFPEKSRVFIVIPAHNESQVIFDVLQEIRECGYQNIIVIDDGSKDNTSEEAQKMENTIILRHKINRGKGAATKTGIEAAKLQGAEIVVTMDGDGQHDPRDIEKLIVPIVQGKKDVVLGSRLKKPEGMPIFKRIHNHIANVITWYLFGLWVTDSQSGFRAYSKKAADIINTRYDRYEYDSEVIREIFIYKLRFKEIPIEVRYTEYSRSKEQKQSFFNGFATVYKMLWKLIR